MRNVRNSKHSFPSNGWYDAECKTMRSQIRRIKIDGQLGNFLNSQAEYKKLLQRKKRQYQQCILNEMYGSTSPQLMWSTLKKVCPSTKNNMPVKQSDLCNQFQNTHNMFNCDYFNKSFESEVKEFMNKYDKNDFKKCCDSSDTVLHDVLGCHFTETEVKNALQIIKGNKSSGLDGLPAEVLKSQVHVLSSPICMMFNFMLDKGEFPSDWIKGLTIPVHKGGDRKKPENYRRITILPLLGKLFETIVNVRLNFVKEALTLQDPFNGGFKKGSMTADNLFVLSGCIQKAEALKQPLYVCFVDFKRAFDTISRDMMFYKLICRGFDGKTIRLLRDMYKKTKMKVCINGILSDIITDETGVNQGSLNSPDMFIDFRYK